METIKDALRKLDYNLGDGDAWRIQSISEALKRIYVQLGGKEDVAGFARTSDIIAAFADMYKGVRGGYQAMLAGVIDGSIGFTKIPDGVKRIRSGAFSNLTKLYSTYIPDSVTSIGSSAYCGCTSLQSVSIPDSVTEIENMAFYGCTKLNSVRILSKNPTIGTSAFGSIASNATIRCAFSNGAVAGAPWGATKATIIYDYTP